MRLAFTSRRAKSLHLIRSDVRFFSDELTLITMFLPSAVTSPCSLNNKSGMCPSIKIRFEIHLQGFHSHDNGNTRITLLGYITLLLLCAYTTVVSQ